MQVVDVDNSESTDEAFTQSKLGARYYSFPPFFCLPTRCCVTVLTLCCDRTGVDSVQIIVGAGGLGTANSCTVESSPLPQYFSSTVEWGDIFGGWSTEGECDNLPEYPVCGLFPQDNLRDLCRWSFAHGFRRFPGDFTPTILKMCQVIEEVYPLYDDLASHECMYARRYRVPVSCTSLRASVGRTK